MTECISIGQHCPAATVIKVAGLRKAAYPFDWVFSGGEGWIESILNDDFKAFLDRSKYKPFDFERSGHDDFCDRFFFHKDPSTDEHYTYYKRCVERFRDRLRGDDPVYLIHLHEWAGDQGEIVRSINTALNNFGAKNYKIISIRNTSIQFSHCDSTAYDGCKIKLDARTENAYLFSLKYHNNWKMLAKELKKAIEIVENN